jgi:hypothetical protein
MSSALAAAHRILPHRRRSCKASGKADMAQPRFTRTRHLRDNYHCMDGGMAGMQAVGARRVAVSTICRGSQPWEPSGHLYVVDLERGVLGSCEVPPAPCLEREPNPRGGIRGGRGLAADGDTLYVANGAEVLRFDRAWRPLGTISHPWCGNVHDIAVHDERLWVCSTANDALAVFDQAGGLTDLIDLRPAALLAGDGARFAAVVDYRDPAGYEAAESNLLHANGIGFDATGVPLVSLGRSEAEEGGSPRGLIARADGLAAPLPVADDVPVPTHNVVPMPDGTLLSLDSGAGTLLVLRPDGTVVRCLTLAPPAPHGFLRGLCPAGGDRVLVGERNRLLVVDLNAGAPTPTIGSFVLAESPRESVYAIALLPEEFEALPARLPES